MRVLSTTAIAAITVVALWTIACGTSARTGPVVHEHHSVERGAATSARVEIGMSGGELEVASGAKTLFEGDFDFNVPVLKPAITYAVERSTGTLKVSQGSASGSYENSWRLSLDETTPVDLHLNLGAGDAEFVLGRVHLRSLAIRMGAGDLVLDLRGMPAQSYSVTVQAGAERHHDSSAGERWHFRAHVRPDRRCQRQRAREARRTLDQHTRGSVVCHDRSAGATRNWRSQACRRVTS